MFEIKIFYLSFIEIIDFIFYLAFGGFFFCNRFWIYI